MQGYRLEEAVVFIRSASTVVPSMHSSKSMEPCKTGFGHKQWEEKR